MAKKQELIKEVGSEELKVFSQEEIVKLQEDVSKMTPEELSDFRNAFNADTMGFNGEEAPIYEYK